MSRRRSVKTGHQVMQFFCDCGWEGKETKVEDWDVQRSRDRIVRVCPNCGESIPEWGALRPIEGVARVAKGSVRDALVDAGVCEQ